MLFSCTAQRECTCLPGRYCGINLSLHNIDWENNTISILQAKTGNPVQLPLLSSVGNAIIDYMQHGRPDGVDDTIIVSHDTVYKVHRLLGVVSLMILP